MNKQHSTQPDASVQSLDPDPCPNHNPLISPTAYFIYDILLVAVSVVAGILFVMEVI